MTIFRSQFFKCYHHFPIHVKLHKIASLSFCYMRLKLMFLKMFCNKKAKKAFTHENLWFNAWEGSRKLKTFFGHAFDILRQKHERNQKFYTLQTLYIEFNRVYKTFAFLEEFIESSTRSRYSNLSWSKKLMK